MKNLLANLGVNLVAIICIVSAAILAHDDKYGWGWFLVVGLVASYSIRFNDDK